MGVRVWWVAQPLRVWVEGGLTLTHSQLLGISGQGLVLGWGPPPTPGPGGIPSIKDTLCSPVARTRPGSVESTVCI